MTTKNILFYSVTVALLLGTFLLLRLSGGFFELDSKKKSVTEARLLKPESKPLKQNSRKAVARNVKKSNAKAQKSIWTDQSWVSDEYLSKANRSLAEQLKVDNDLKHLLELFEKNKHGDFIRELEALLEQYPDVPEYHAMRGDYYFNTMEYDKAKASIKKLLDFDKTNFVARANLAKIDAINGDYDSALSVVREGLALDPGRMMAIRNLFELHMLKDEDPDAAIAEIETLYRNNPDKGNIAVALSSFKKDPSERLSILENAYRSDPGNPLLAQGLGREEFLKNNFEAARGFLEKSLNSSDTMSESDRMASEALLFETFVGLKDYEQAKRFVQGLEEKNPKDESLAFYRMRLEESRNNSKGF